jgi:hypothetical protein
MDKATIRTLSDADLDLLRETEPPRLRKLDEDDLIALHARVRRARNKYSKLYRRRSSAKVSSDKSRARASAVNQRTARKAEVFEDALARVSRHLAKAARVSADQLKQDRLAAARGQKGSGKPAKGAKASKGKGAGRAEAKGSSAAKKKRRTPISKRSSASARATTRRAQAKRAGK